jgi:hypothetical protein
LTVLAIRNLHEIQTYLLMPEASSVQFTVGKIDAGLAILLSADNHVLEFPSAMLPVLWFNAGQGGGGFDSQHYDRAQQGRGAKAARGLSSASNRNISGVQQASSNTSDRIEESDSDQCDYQVEFDTIVFCNLQGNRCISKWN